MTTAHPTTAIPAPRIAGEMVGVQYLRGIAAMMVVVFHLQPAIERMGYAGGWLPGLSSGVDIFFVISGFIMWVTTNGKAITPTEFWRRRIVRIVPLYWLITSFMVVLMLIAPHALQTSRFAGMHVFMSYIFLPWPHPLKPVMEPVAMPGWTLNYEMFFYLIFGLFLLARPRVRMAGTIAALVALVAIGALLGARPLTIPGFYTSSIMLEFGFGMAIGGVVTRGDLISRIPTPVAWALLLVGFACVLLSPNGVERALGRGIASAAIVVAVLAIEARGGLPSLSTLHHVGDSSYSIYLTHFILLSGFGQAWRLLHLQALPGGIILFCVLAVTACAAGGWLCYRWVERPLIELFRQRSRSGARVRPAAAGTTTS